jgi:hypothetical protein
MANYSLIIPSFDIKNTRAPVKDTLFASTSVKVMNASGGLHKDWGAQTAPPLGDHDEGYVSLSPPLIWNVEVPGPTPEQPDGGAVYWSFLLVNKGHFNSAFAAVLSKAADVFAGALASGAGAPAGLGGLGALGLQQLLGLLTADCDGVVAAGAFTFTAAELAGMVPSQVSKDNPGTDSSTGCGANSFYVVNYEIQSLDAVVAQSDWWWCHKCQGLYFAGQPGSVCPAGGPHDLTGSSDYSLVLNDPAGQWNWRWCHKCQGLYFAGQPGSVCPAGGPHDMMGSGNYSLIIDNTAAPGQHDWRWCHKCQGLYFSGNSGSICPAGGPHDMTGSGDYSLNALAQTSSDKMNLGHDSR